jgi:hypothetical protein
MQRRAVVVQGAQEPGQILAALVALELLLVEQLVGVLG